MVEERVCDFTGESIEPGTGIMYVRSDGSVLHFVDAKAEKNYFKGREPRDLPWTEAGREQRERAAADDAADSPTPEPAEEAEETVPDEVTDTDVDATEPEADRDADADPDVAESATSEGPGAGNE